MSSDEIYNAAYLRLEMAEKIWKTRREEDYARAERLYFEAIQLREQLDQL